MRILVTDGNTRAALAIVRSLGKNGHDIFVGEKHHPSLASSSKYCRQKINYPDPVTNPEFFVKHIAGIIVDEKIDILLPVTDVTIHSLLNEENKIRSICQFPLADKKIVDIAADKYKTFQLAEDLGVPIPRTIYMKIPEPDKEINSLGFPIVIKPSRSRYITSNGWRSSSVTYANNSDELQKVIRYKDINEYPLLLQERIAGAGVGIFMLVQNGQVNAVFSHRRIREKPPSGGVSTYRESIAVDPEAQRYAEKLLKAIDWSGVAMVEFKLDERDHKTKLMEINGRFWGSLQLAIDAGVNFPSLLIDLPDKNQNGPDLSYKIGVKTRWFWGDVDSLLSILFKTAKSLNLPPNHPSRLVYLMNFMKLWRKDEHYEVASLTDCKPWLYESVNWIRGKSI
jgi:predicted ATP-grasp superfamily ATP-dependent carboligase